MSVLTVMGNAKASECGTDNYVCSPRFFIHKPLPVEGNDGRPFVIYIPMATKKSPWFGKRWTKSLITWLDSAIFKAETRPTFVPMDSSFCGSFTIGIIAGLTIFVMAFMDDAERLSMIASSAGAVIALLWSAVYLYKNLACFDSVGAKIGRTVYVVALNLIGYAAGLMIAMFGALFAVTCLILWGVFSLWIGDFGKSGTSSRKSGVSTIFTSEGQFRGEGATNGDVFEDSVGQRYVYRNGEFYKD